MQSCNEHMKNIEECDSKTKAHEKMILESG
jgi:hypothetical protein